MAFVAEAVFHLLPFALLLGLLGAVFGKANPDVPMWTSIVLVSFNVYGDTGIFKKRIAHFCIAPFFVVGFVAR